MALFADSLQSFHKVVIEDNMNNVTIPFFASVTLALAYLIPQSVQKMPSSVEMATVFYLSGDVMMIMIVQMGLMKITALVSTIYLLIQSILFVCPIKRL